MQLKLAIVSGPHRGKEFCFDKHDTFLVGRAKEAHFQLSNDDLSLPRRHFLLEVNPPRCRLINLSGRNRTLLNGLKVESAELSNGDEIEASHTVFKVKVIGSDSEDDDTFNLLAVSKPFDPTHEYKPALEIRGYRIEGEIGRGSIGVVYRGIRKKDKRPFAIKTIAPAPGVSRKQIDRFLREAKTLTQFQHENIVAIHKVGEADGLVYLVMEFVDGQNLEQRIRERGPEDVITAVRILCQLLKGLVYAHGKGSVHRDIKPSNILIASKGEKRIAKLANFGLARVIDSSRLCGLKMQGELSGAVAFSAPEQLTHYRHIHAAADQYSAAATLYKMMCDNYTHDFSKEIETQIAQIVMNDATPILDHRPEVTSRLAEVIHKALSRDPLQRYPDIVAFRKALKWFV